MAPLIPPHLQLPALFLGLVVGYVLFLAFFTDAFKEGGSFGLFGSQPRSTQARSDWVEIVGETVLYPVNGAPVLKKNYATFFLDRTDFMVAMGQVGLERKTREAISPGNFKETFEFKACIKRTQKLENGQDRPLAQAGGRDRVETVKVRAILDVTLGEDDESKVNDVKTVQATLLTPQGAYIDLNDYDVVAGDMLQILNARVTTLNCDVHKQGVSSGQ